MEKLGLDEQRVALPLLGVPSCRMHNVRSRVRARSDVLELQLIAASDASCPIHVVFMRLKGKSYISSFLGIGAAFHDADEVTSADVGALADDIKLLLTSRIVEELVTWRPNLQVCRYSTMNLQLNGHPVSVTGNSYDADVEGSRPASPRVCLPWIETE